MPEVVLNTPLADALNAAIQPKLIEVGWGSGGSDDGALAEYIVLMLANGKTQTQIAEELSGDLLNLGQNDPVAAEFSRWLFRELESLSGQMGGGDASASAEAASSASQGQAQGDTEMQTTEANGHELNAPTGPKSMRNGATNPLRGGFGAGRDRRMLGQMTKAMDRTHDSPLHRVRAGTGNERINSHSRGSLPTGPRGVGAVGRVPRNQNVRTQQLANFAAGMGSPAGPNMGIMTNGPGNPWGMQGGAPVPQAGELFAVLEQQSRMMMQMQQQLLMQGQQVQHVQQIQGQGQGKPLFERVQHPNRGGAGFRRGGGHNQGQGQGQYQNGGRSHQHGPPGQNNTEQPAGGDVSMDGAVEDNTATAATGGDTDMTSQSATTSKALAPEDTVCKFNLYCTNKECKFAHQSPAAPPGTAIDVKDICTFGAACKNRKCVARHPSPAAKTHHQAQEDCKFFPNCTNPRCPFRHPEMPLCRNGAECKKEGCKFTHVRTPCKYNPCTNRYCNFYHEEGQRGVFQDKVWTAADGPNPAGASQQGGQQQHVSERKFVDDDVPVEVVVPDAVDEQQHGPAGVDVAIA